MVPSLNNILVPVDFSDNSRIAVQKAIDLVDITGTIHLFHVQGILYSSFTEIFHRAFNGYSQREVNIEKQRTRDLLEYIKSEINHARPEIEVVCSVAFGEPVERAIGNFAKLTKADLIVIGKHAHHPFLPFLNTVVPSRLTSFSGLPVLTAKPGSIDTPLNQVVIPVGSQFPERKLEILETLRSKFKFHIRLVVFQSDINKLSFPLQYLVNKLKLLRNNKSVSVEHDVLKATDKAKALIKYCEKVGADILIVQPGAETKTKGWPGSYISDFIPASSKTQVLSISGI